MSYELTDRGISSWKWKNDPLNTQVVLSEDTYKRYAPDVQPSLPLLGELILPEGTPETVEKTVSFESDGDTLLMISTVRNTGTENVDLEYIRIALPMDQCFREDNVFKYEQNIIRHTGLIGNCAYMYWQKPSGKPPIYLMVAQEDTEVNRFFVDQRFERHSIDVTFEGLYLLEMTDIPIRLKVGEEKKYRFRIAIIESENQINAALKALGGLGTDVLPGMAVQRREKLTVILDTTRTVERVYFSDDCAEVTEIGNGIYESVGAGSGEKKLIVSYADGGFSRLKFFIIDKVSDIIHDHSAHIAKNQFETDSTDPCYHGILAWNMTDRCRVNSKNNPFVNWMAGGSDEIGLVSGLFLSEKNCYWPNEDEIRVLGLHFKDFIEERLTEQPGNRVHRMVPWYKMFEPWAGYGADDVWRAYNYVHVSNISFNMYRIAKEGKYPFLEDAKYYLKKTYDYSIAMFNYWMYPEGKGATEYGNMGEMNMPLKFAKAFREEGLTEEAEHFEEIMLKKGRFFSTKQYPFGSEMAFDTTAYEAVYAYAKLTGDTALEHRSVRASITNRARTPLWNKYAVDVRSEGDSYWNVSYMTQLGVWPAVDMLLDGYSTDVNNALIAHAATLGGFCMYNSGGYWDDAPINRHASWWVMNERLNQGNSPECFKPQRKISGEVSLGYFGALYSTCSFLIEHPKLGKYSLGCQIKTDEEKTEIIPDKCFGIRFCDLIHGFALVCESGEMSSIRINENKISVTVKGIDGRSADVVLRVRLDKPGEWKELRAPQGKETVFEIKN